jgi:hypothetical protein
MLSNLEGNGEAESAVKIAKKILVQKDSHLTLLNYRSSKHSATGVSPVEIIMSRKLQTRLPVLPAKLTPQVPDHSAVKAADSSAKDAYKQRYDERYGVKQMTPLDPGQQVRLKLDKEKG